MITVATSVIGREVRQVPIAFSGPNTKRETPSGLMHFYTIRKSSIERGRRGGGNPPLDMGLIRAYTYSSKLSTCMVTSGTNGGRIKCTIAVIHWRYALY